MCTKGLAVTATVTPPVTSHPSLLTSLELNSHPLRALRAPNVHRRSVKSWGASSLVAELDWGLAEGIAVVSPLRG